MDSMFVTCRNTDVSKRRIQDPVSARFRIMVDFLFLGNQSAAARFLGFSPSVINQVVNGRVSASASLRGAFFDHPRINRQWAEFGKGFPFTIICPRTPVSAIVDSNKLELFKAIYNAADLATDLA